MAVFEFMYIFLTVRNMEEWALEPQTVHITCYCISAHLAACWYKRGLPDSCLSESGNYTGMPV